jgi:asparagine synthase (glutamine-hydrolysing)
MCGVTGFLDSAHTLSHEELNQRVKRMSEAIHHRGPDDSGVWVDSSGGAAFGFQRLAILDLSPAGHQPMFSADERFVMIYNGEVYNFAELRDELLPLGYAFHGHSDTEIMLAAISEWGMQAAVRKFNGMFAFAAFDRTERILYLVRDRLGIKPLYYGWQGDTFIFGSELKSLRAYPGFQAEIDRNALALYLRLNYIPAPHTIYQGIYKLLPGTILALTDQRTGQSPAIVPYWSAREVAEAGVRHAFVGSEQDAIDQLDAMLRQSTRERMIADVPLGAFLSGGIDSSTIAALMQAQSRIPVKTFTIGFKEAGFDEARYAKQVARHLGTEHTELYLTSQEAQAVIPKLPALFDEPFADSSQIPTYLLAMLTRQQVTVALSGDGGDELFAGYNRYFWTPNYWHRIGWIPQKARIAAAAALQRVPPQSWNGLLTNKWIPPRFRYPNSADKILKASEVLRAATYEQVYFDLISHWKTPAAVVINGFEPETVLTSPSLRADIPDPISLMMYLDLVTYLPDDILVKVDRASMGVSLEVRAPFLDNHEVVEFAWQLPMNLKIRNGQGKWILRQVLNRYVPAHLIERPKMGFGVPIDAWLRGPLREWGEELLDKTRIQREGFFNHEPIRQKWQEHLSGRRNWQYDLWEILMFQAWLENLRL